MGAKLSGGGASGKYDLGQNSDINVTPFVDVMLVLLIIFMVSAPLATVSIKVDLPPAVPPKDKVVAKPTYISIKRDGIYIVEQKTSLDRLTADFLVRLTQNSGVTAPDPKQSTILIRADRDVVYEDFMHVINQLQGEGFYKVGLISEDLG
ncbi:MAG: biopolymer transporter ExbD [Caulobacteraceae bacterium]